MNRSNSYSHSFNETFKESRMPVKNSGHIMEELMRSRNSGTDTAFVTEVNFAL
ncbi:MAG: hypothetical protein QMC67_02150 [Candidatus Wallbacteria bacterium]